MKDKKKANFGGPKKRLPRAGNTLDETPQMQVVCGLRTAERVIHDGVIPYESHGVVALVKSLG